MRGVALRQFDVRVKYKGRPYGSHESVGADSMTLVDGSYCFWLHNVDGSGQESREMTASFRAADVESIKESAYPVSDAAVIRRVVDVLVVCIVEKAKADGEPISGEQAENERKAWTARFREVFAAVRAGGSAIRELLTTASLFDKLLG